MTQPPRRDRFRADHGDAARTQRDPSPRPRPERPAPSRPHRAAEGEVTSRPRWVRLARRAAWAAAAMAVVVVLAVFVFPTRTYLDQRRQLSATSRALHVLDAQNAQLSAEEARLRTDAEIERIGREQYHLVRPGEQAFAILPPPASTTPTRPAARRPHATGWWHTLTGWL